MTTNHLSVRAANFHEIISDADFETKNAVILIALNEAPRSNPDQIAAMVGLRDLYVRPRVSELKELGLIDVVGVSHQTKAGRAAHALMVSHPWSDMLSE